MGFTAGHVGNTRTCEGHRAERTPPRRRRSLRSRFVAIPRDLPDARADVSSVLLRHHRRVPLPPLWLLQIRPLPVLTCGKSVWISPRRQPRRRLRTRDAKEGLRPPGSTADATLGGRVTTSGLRRGDTHVSTQTGGRFHTGTTGHGLRVSGRVHHRFLICDLKHQLLSVALTCVIVTFLVAVSSPRRQPRGRGTGPCVPGRGCPTARHWLQGQRTQSWADGRPDHAAR